ncbi:MAG: sugar phosphate nucleotidyltransferase [Candidatus Zixiibacteriota bacterium]
MSERAMDAVILAGGKGSRLQPFTNELPKPLVPLGETPIIALLLRQLRKTGVTRAHLAVNHLAHLIMAVLGDGAGLGLEITYTVEDQPLSTIGPLRLIKNLPEHFIVANGDILTDLDVSSLYDAHVASKALVTVATYPRTERIDFGVLETDSNHRVIGFQEKPAYEFRVSMGLYVMSKRVLEFVPENRAYGFDELILDLLERGELVKEYPYSGFWLDIGRPDDYERAQMDRERIEKLLL